MGSVHQTLTASQLHDVTTDKQGVLGQVARTADGRIYRYAKNGNTALAAGATVDAGGAPVHSSTTTDAGKVGDGVVNLAAGPNNPDVYEDGVAVIASAQYLVNDATKSGVLSLADHVDTPFAKGAAVKINQNQFCGVKAGTAKVIGTAEVAVPANAYFWAFVSA